MASVQKLKALLGRQCVVAGSPSSSSRSPTTSPLFQIRRRKTLRMFLTRAGSARRKSDSPPTSSSAPPPPDNPKTATLLLSNKLKDLFVSSPPPPLVDNGTIIMDLEELSSSTAPAPAPAPARTAPASHRPLTAVFRYRLLRRPWRPMLLSIPEYAAATETHY